jgi:hypothetical protein
MSERGVYAVDRGVFEHDLFASDDPYSRLEAWLRVLADASWKHRRRRVAGKVFELQRGQLVASLRFLASQWRWSEPRVRRFLAALVSEGMIDVSTDAGVTVITICKYDAYQRVSLRSDAAVLGATDAGATQERRKREDKEDKESKNLLPAIADDWPADHEKQFWEKYPNKVGKADALQKLQRARKQGVPWSELMAGLIRYTQKTDDRPWCNPATWLNQQRWTDDPATNLRSNSSGYGRSRALQDDQLSVSKALDRQMESGITFGPRPSLLPDARQSDLRLLPKG